MRSSHLALGVGLIALAGFAAWRYFQPKATVTIEDPDTGEEIPTTPQFDVLDYVYNEAIDVVNYVSPQGEQYRGLFNTVETQYGIPHGLLFRQAYQECHFRQDIITGEKVSPAGAVGMMQIVLRYHPDISYDEAVDPDACVPYAGRYMAYLHNRFKDWRLALAAYNWGEGNINKYGFLNWPQETRDYVAQITADVPLVSVS